jgi:hypothetical protein
MWIVLRHLLQETVLLQALPWHDDYAGAVGPQLLRRAPRFSRSQLPQMVSRRSTRQTINTTAVPNSMPPEQEEPCS